MVLSLEAPTTATVLGFKSALISGMARLSQA
jgi:hypothetical protein